MKRIILSVALVLCTSVLAMAQITTGTPSARNIRTGNRPQEGHFGIYLGMNSNVFQNFSSNKKTNLEVSPLPMVNFKYMYSDKLELRLGVELSRSRESLGVKSKQTVNNVDYNIKGNCKYVESDVHFNPGISYHFNSNNILDVYVGAEATFGWSRNSFFSDYTSLEFNSNNQVFTVDGHDNTRKASFQYGIGAFIGLQAFIADLPLSIGVEYGLSSIFDTRLRYKREYKHGSGDEMVTYTADMSELPNLNSRLADSEISGEGMSAKKGEIGNQFRITITYYFK